MILVLLCALSLAQAFKIGEDSGYNSLYYTAYSAYKLNPNYIGAFPQQRMYTSRIKFNPSYVETFQPTRDNVLITDPGRDPLMQNLNLGAWQLAVSVVAAVGPDAQSLLKEGNLVYTYPDCPIANRIWLNKASGEQGDLVCKATAAGLIAGWTNIMCEERSCVAPIKDKCAWVARSPRRDRPNYCLLPLAQIRGIVNPSTNGTTPVEVSRISRPRDKWMSWRRENVNQYLSNNL